MCEAKFDIHINISKEDIDDIMCTALEGGITYWCRKAKVIGEYLGEFASEQISRGGSLVLYPYDDNKAYVLTMQSLLNGMEKAMKEGILIDYGWWSLDGIDTCNIDADVADAIIQLALFGEIIYG